MFITFEGIEGCGKTTQMRRLKDGLRAYGVPFVSTLEPGGTEIGKKVRQILLDSRNRNLTPLAELLLYSADRAQHVEEVIRPALDQDKWLICDRYFDATVAYQGLARGQDLGLIQFLNGKVTGGISPDITFLLDCPVEIGLSRALKRNEEQKSKGQDRFEREKIAFHQKVRKAYLDLAKEYPKRFAVIDATMDVEDVEKEIFKHIKPFLDLQVPR
ncbi:MAG: dTMP kinase [Desulfobacterales bacterium]|nr:dTMP kinase [Desulfobacterales bacterium]